ncbi:MAG TPA: hypothetical protein VI168_04215 [Croceibacterium sp.]
MLPFEQESSPKTGPRPDGAWLPPQFAQTMRGLESLPLGERVAQAIVWCALAATRERGIRAAARPGSAFHDAAWDILLHLLFEDARGRVATVEGLAAIEGLAPDECAPWIDALEDLCLVERLAIPGMRARRVLPTAPARQAMLELLLEPASWDGPALCREITMWQLAQRARMHMLQD